MITETKPDLAFFYERLAKYYDRIYHYVDYQQQVNLFEKVFRRFAQNAEKSVVDFACGTGSHLQLFEQKGFETVGVDLSEFMLTEAKRKCDHTLFVHDDMTRVSLERQFGLALCFFKSILYARPISRFQKMVDNLRNHLLPGGIAIFDVVDKSFGQSLNGVEQIYDQEDAYLSFFPRWHYKGNGEFLDLQLQFKIQEGGDSLLTLDDHHSLCAITIPEVCQIVQACGMKAICLMRDSPEIQEWDGTSPFAIIVAQKPYPP